MKRKKVDKNQNEIQGHRSSGKDEGGEKIRERFDDEEKEES